MLPTSHYAVLAGRVTDEHRLNDAERRDIHEVVARLPAELQALLPVRYPVAPLAPDGGAWQILLDAPDQALMSAVFARAFVKAEMAIPAADCCVAVGIGPVEFGGAFGATGADGPAFQRAERALDELSRGMVVAGGPAPESGVSETVALIDHIVSSWTPPQAQAMLGLLAGKTQREIGREWPDEPISQQAVAQHLARAGARAILPALDWYRGRMHDQQLWKSG